MLLGSLDDLYRQLLTEERLPPVGYQRRRVRFLVDLDTDGRCISIIDTSPDETVRTVPDVGRTSGVKAFLACDNGQYVLGLPKRNGDKAMRDAVKCNDAFLGRLDTAARALEAEDGVAAKSLRVIADFVSDRDEALRQFRNRNIPCDFNDIGELPEASARIALRVDGVDPVELPSIRSWWAEIANDDLSGEVEGLCQISGIRSRLARKLPGLSVKPGTPQALISANFDAAERYNAKQSGGAQIAVPVAIRSHQALNWLLSDEHHHRRIGDLTFVWWLAADVAFDPFNLIAQPHEDDVAALLASPWTGRRGLRPSDDFRMLGLSLTEG
ncbi:MAG: type I-C CRISPR-associated protein Cas8c/Csd1, partial [Mycobacterium sp.]|nr:type I-C CRISPR-associated protein Cas8c/Csd1 [Mycobacterium sp.]